MTTVEQLAALENEFGHALSLNAYNMFTQLWHLLLRLSMDEPSSDEFDRIKSLVFRLSQESVARVLANGHIDRLIDLDPPLETVLTNKHERLESLNAQKSLAAIRANRTAAPREALAELGSVLKRIRNKLEHGFKTPAGPRDQEILDAACSIVAAVVQECLALRRGEVTNAAPVASSRAS